MLRGRRIAFDYGDRRIGVAICDPDGILATPLDFLDAAHPKLFSHIDALFDEYQPICIYVGEPKLLSGKDGEAVTKAKAFGDCLKERTNIPIIYIDERLSTVDAQRKLAQSGKSAKESKTLIDSMSAVGILESGLAREDR